MNATENIQKGVTNSCGIFPFRLTQFSYDATQKHVYMMQFACTHMRQMYAIWNKNHKLNLGTQKNLNYVGDVLLSNQYYERLN